MIGAKQVGGVYIPIDGDNRGFKRELRESERAARTSTGRVRREFAKTTRSADRLNKSILASRTSMLALGAAAGIALAGATRVIADFSQAMSTVRAVTGATEQQYAALTERARELGAVTRFSATQAADGMTFLARAGFNVDQVLGSIEGTLQLAQAGGLSLADAADIASNVLQGMGLQVDQTARAVDVLALSANSSNTNVRQLGDALKYVAPIASGLGVGLEETTAAIGALSDAGLQGEMAGTGLRKVMISLEKQSKQGVDLLASYGLSMEDVSVSANGLTPALQKLADAGITTGEAMTLFGLRGGPAFEVLVNSIPKVERMTDVLGDAGGTAARVATIMDDNLNGAILRARSALEEMVLALGAAGGTAALQASFEGLANLFRIAAENADILAIAAVALTARALIPLVKTAVGPAIPRLGAYSASLLNVARSAGVATAANQALTASVSLANRAFYAMGGPATAAILAAAAAFYQIHTDAKRARQAIADVEAAIDASAAAMEATAKYDTFEVIGQSANRTIPIFNGVRDAIREVSAALDDATVSGFVNEATQVFSALESARSTLSETNAERERLAEKYKYAIKLNPAVADEIGLNDLDDAAIKARQQVAILEGRLKNIGSNVFGEIDILSAFQNGGLDEVAATLRARLQEFGDDASEIVVDSAKSAIGGESSDDEDGLSEEDLKRNKILRDLELERAKGNDVRIQQLETELMIMDRMQEYMDEGLKTEKARAKALEDIKALRIAEGQSGALFNVDPFGSRPGANDNTADLAEAKISFRQTFKSAWKQAAADRDVGGAIENAFASGAERGLDRALDKIADTVFDLFADALSGIDGKGAIGSIFGGIGGAVSSFFGGKASGGDVNGGSRYLVGERGPEMFVPSSDGFIVPNDQLKGIPVPSGAAGIGIRTGDIIVQGDASERTLLLIQDAQAQQAAQLPAAVRAVVQDDIARGRY